MISKTITAKRTIITLAASAGCCLAIWQAARTGMARTLSEYAVKTSNIDAADTAVMLSATDAETHSARAVVLQQAQNYSDAQVEIERAVQLRPRDYLTWLLLGIIRDDNHDQEGAMLAFRQSIVLAPAYAQPHWLLGNLLLRMNRPDEAFAELRQAAASNPAVLPNVIDLAWGVYGDVSAVLGIIQPHTDSARLELALFFARHQQASAAAEQFVSAGDVPKNKSNALLAELLKARAFGDAYRVWARMHGAPSTDAIATIRDGGFEAPVTVGESGFGWQITPDIPNVMLSVDRDEHQSGAKSLRIDFRGESIPLQPLVTQLILVKPGTSYSLRFAAMSREVISASLPIIIIKDASDPAQPTLAKSSPLGADGKGWQEFSIDVKTGSKSEAILLSVERQNCSASPCPAFGALWLDSFSIAAAVPPDVR